MGKKSFRLQNSKPAPKKVEEITIEDILEDAKDGVLKDKSIEAVKKLTAEKKSKS